MCPAVGAGGVVSVSIHGVVSWTGSSAWNCIWLQWEVNTIRDRVCQGCFITLPTAALPGPDAPMMCESCGRVLCWR